MYNIVYSYVCPREIRNIIANKCLQKFRNIYITLHKNKLITLIHK